MASDEAEHTTLQSLRSVALDLRERLADFERNRYGEE